MRRPQDDTRLLYAWCVLAYALVVAVMWVVYT